MRLSAEAAATMEHFKATVDAGVSSKGLKRASK
jgi:hypothetical protein